MHGATLQMPQQKRSMTAHASHLRTASHAGIVRLKELPVCAQVTGQNADMADLQRLMMRGRTKLNASQQQNLTVRLALRLPVHELEVAS